MLLYLLTTVVKAKTQTKERERRGSALERTHDTIPMD